MKDLFWPKTLFSVLIWLTIVGLSLYFFLAQVAIYLGGYRSETFGESLFNNQLWVALHLVGGTLALFLGPLQFWKAFRDRFLGFHRISGKLYLFGVLLIGISGLRLSLISSCVPCRVSLFILSVLVCTSALLAWKAILNLKVGIHQRMMIRSYILVFSFVLVRLESLLPLEYLFGEIEDPLLRRVVNEYFFSFVPLLAAEIYWAWWPAVKLVFCRTH